MREKLSEKKLFSFSINIQNIAPKLCPEISNIGKIGNLGLRSVCHSTVILTSQEGINLLVMDLLYVNFEPLMLPGLIKSSMKTEQKDF